MVRVALLSSIESLSDGERRPRAFARIGGRTILQRQIDFAHSLGCEQVACLSDSLHPELIDIQHCAEKAGLRFQVLRDIRPLSGLVKAADEVLVLADGLTFEESVAEGALGNGKGVLTLPADAAVPLGFERLDRDFAWAGAMVISGSLIEQLGEMPADIDPQSSLLRLALQSGARVRPVAETALADHDWVVVQTSEDLESFQTKWLNGVAEPASFIAPVSAAADRAALAVLRRHTNPAKASRVIGGLAYALMGVALICGYFSYPTAGFIVGAIAAFSARFGITTSAIVGGGRELSKGGRILAKLPPATLDLALVGLVVLSVPRTEMATALFASMMLIGLLRLSAVPNADSLPKRLQHLFEDRGILAIGLGISLAFGKILIVIQVFAVFLLLLLLYQTYSVRITRA